MPEISISLVGTTSCGWYGVLYQTEHIWRMTAGAAPWNDAGCEVELARDDGEEHPQDDAHHESPHGELLLAIGGVTRALLVQPYGVQQKGVPAALGG